MIWASTRGNLSLVVLISAFVIRFLESIISRLATSEMSNFEIVCVAEETGLSLAFSKTPKIGFVASRPISYSLSGKM